ncbi:MAG TPA: carboxypeptidase-like regulatory domain-containing protein, partial [Prolixibacteraceae bacterium]|nr:carboxypeptidase-like regulatory domain-containing protein [Prolixibacteraceae bacterium]
MRSKFAKLRIALLALAMVLVQTTFAQEKSISGMVTDADSGEPLPGVTVVVEGTTIGTTTNFEGAYTIGVEEGKTLVYSYIGYNTQKIKITDQNTINVKLSMEVEDLGEVVVIGYGVQKKTDKTGAVSQIKAEDLNKGVVSDPIQAMQGKASGVMITRKGGDPNAGFSVRVRGAAGFEAGTDPLYVVDGVPGVDATTIAPEDIETFNVLKDAASTAIYGSRGANGVIIITTKKGKEGKSVVNLSSKVSIETIANTLDMLTADELRNFSSENGLEMTDNGDNTDWQNEIYRTGISQNHNLNFSGGNKYSKFYASVTHSEWEGILKGTSKERTIGKINIEHKAINERLTLSGT